MSHYRTTPAQRAYLKRRYAEQARNAPPCDCPGCDECKGFVKGCACTDVQGMANLREVLAKRGKKDDATE